MLMNQTQLHTLRILFTLMLMSVCISTSLHAVPRSHGIGLRVAFWNVTDHPTRIDLGGYGESATVNIGGAGSWIYFFSRMHNNWFLEFHLGAVAGVHEEHDEYLIFAKIQPSYDTVRSDPRFIELLKKMNMEP